MATDVERLIVSLEAQTRAFQRELSKANGTANRQARSIERRFQQMNRNLSASFAGLGSTLTRAFAVAGGLRGMQTLLDSATRIDNALKVAGLSGAELEKVYNRLRDSAIKNAAPLETLVTLYGRASLVQKELNVTQEEMLNFTDKIALALRVSGQSAAESSGALLQLSQALGSGIVRAEEFNSVLEGALPIALAAAAGLEEAGGSVAKLRQLVVDGAISSEVFFRAFEAGSVILEQKVAGATLTASQGLENVRTALIDATREFAHGSMAAESLGDAFGMMAERINSINFEAFGEQVRELIGLVNQVREAIGWLSNMGANIGAATGLDRIGELATGGEVQQSYLGGALTVTSQRALQNRIDQAFGQAVETAGTLTEEAIRQSAGTVTTEKAGRLPTSVVRPVSLADFTPAAATGGGGGGRGRRSIASELREGAKAARELEQAERGAEQAANDLGGAVGGAMRGLVDALEDGKLEAHELLGILGQVAQQLLSMPGAPGGFLGGFLSSIFHQGGVVGGSAPKRSVHPAVFSGARRMHSGGVAGGLRPDEVPAILQRGEIVLPRGTKASGGGTSVIINAPIHAPGADTVALARVERSVKELGRNIPKMVDQRVNDRQTRGTRP